MVPAAKLSGSLHVKPEVDNASMTTTLFTFMVAEFCLRCPQHKRVNGHLTRLIKLSKLVSPRPRLQHSLRLFSFDLEEADSLLRADAMLLQAIAALPVELQSEAAKQDFTPFPVQRRIFTETPPIPDFKAKVAKR
uniref:Uncharacterized protein n=1 Tax=Chrysotila carterae TaxID=13221 RepID=A0A7S4B4M2_CHRCT